MQFLRRVVRTALLLSGLSASDLWAQDQVPAPAQPPAPSPLAQPITIDGAASDGPIHTLHVYMDLIQVPVLVLDAFHERMKPVDPARFNVSLDSGPAFHPKRVRQQGEDPITLGIVLDQTGQQAALMPEMAKAISGLAPGSLTPRDHVTLFSMDCSMIRTLRDVPADAAVLKSGVERALAPRLERLKLKHHDCEKHIYLWDAITFAVNQLAELPGRRALLVVTSGIDGGSKTPWDDVRAYAQQKGVAIFGYAPRRYSAAEMVQLRGGSASSEDLFNTLCELSGGMLIRSDPDSVGRQFQRLITTLRERYILEFARARNESAGEHNLQVTVAKANGAFVRPAGVSIILPDGAQANDPLTIPRDATDAPQMGDRKILPKKK